MSPDYSQARWRIKTTSFVLTLAPLVISCAALAFSQAVFAETLWQVEDEFVDIVPSESQQVNSHPLKIGADALLDMLLKLEVVRENKKVSRRSRQSEDKEERSSLFSEETAEQLADYLSKALRRASPDQDVLFQIKDNVSFIGSIGKPVITTGRVFWRNNRLNIIFGSIHKTFKKRYVLGRETELFSPPDLPTRDTALYPGETIAEESGIMFAKTRDGSGRKGHRRDWIIISPQVLRQAQAVSKKSEANIKKRKVKSMRQDKGDDSLKTRLKRLKNLYDKGLISKEMYQRRVELILEDEI